MIRAGQFTTRTHQRLIDLAIDSVEDDEHIGMPELVTSEITELLDCFSPADAMLTKYPLEPIKIYATKKRSVNFNIAKI